MDKPNDTVERTSKHADAPHLPAAAARSPTMHSRIGRCYTEGKSRLPAFSTSPICPKHEPAATDHFRL